MIRVDGSYGEGGGQVLRTALSLSAITGRAFELEHIRARRPNPGLQAQHLTAVHAVGDLCAAEFEGAELGSRTLTFAPRSPPRPGHYSWDVGTAGATTLVLQAVLWPLALADGSSSLELIGGTHVAWSPPADYVRDVYLWMLQQTRAEPIAELEAEIWGWYPVGGGRLRIHIPGRAEAPRLCVLERGALRRVSVRSAASNLPRHIIERQASQAETCLRKQGIVPNVVMSGPPSPGKGTLVFVLAEYQHVRAGFTAYGRIRKPAEEVADEACRAFVRYHRRGQPVDQHLGDQLLLPVSLARGATRYAVSMVTQHLITNAWLIKQFLGVEVSITGSEREPGLVVVEATAR